VGDGNVAKGTSHCSVFKQKLFSQKKIMAAKAVLFRVKTERQFCTAVIPALPAALSADYKGL
jgi:hypothetical protein